jgi:hypothetical protein
MSQTEFWKREFRVESLKAGRHVFDTIVELIPRDVYERLRGLHDEEQTWENMIRALEIKYEQQSYEGLTFDREGFAHGFLGRLHEDWYGVRGDIDV